MDDNVPLTENDWLQFVLKCMELISALIISYYSGVQTSKGGHPFAGPVTERFKATLAHFSADLDDGLFNWEVVFVKHFWEEVKPTSLFRNQKDFIEIISRLALSKEQCPTLFLAGKTLMSEHSLSRPDTSFLLPWNVKTGELL